MKYMITFLLVVLCTPIWADKFCKHDPICRSISNSCGIALQNLNGQWEWDTDPINLLRTPRARWAIKNLGKYDCPVKLPSSIKTWEIEENCSIATYESGGLLSWRYRGMANTQGWVISLVEHLKARGIDCRIGKTKRNTTKTIYTNNSSNSTSKQVNEDEVLKNEFNKLNLYKRKEIQKYLYAKGYYKSSIDGVWGYRTGVAIKQALANSYNMKNQIWVRKQLNLMKSSSNSTSTTKTSNNRSSIQSSLSNNDLCNKATYRSASDGKMKWSTVSYNSKTVKEAKSRGLTCGVGSTNTSNSSSSSSTNWVKTYQNNSTTSSTGSTSSNKTKVNKKVVTERDRQKALNQIKLGLCLMQNTSSNVFQGLAQCGNQMFGGQSVDWDYQPGNGQWVCRRLKGTVGAGQYAPLRECAGYPKNDSRWP